MTNDNSTFETWTRPEEFTNFIEAQGTGFIFKHSTRCPVSTFAHGEVAEFVQEHPGIPLRIVLVVEHRATAREIAARLGVPHASPQVILVRDGKAVWDASHNGVTASALAQAWQSTTAS